MISQHHYDAVAAELQKGYLRPGLWTRAVAESGGEGTEARGLYIRLRVAELAGDDSWPTPKSKACGAKSERGSEPPTGTSTSSSGLGKLAGVLEPVHNPPFLHRMNGTGLALLGELKDKEILPFYFVRCFYTVLWIPVAPRGIYLVKHPVDRNGRGLLETYEFHGKAEVENLRRVYDPDTIKRFNMSVAADAATTVAILVIGLLLLSAAIVAAKQRWPSF